MFYRNDIWYDRIMFNSVVLQNHEKRVLSLMLQQFACHKSDLFEYFIQSDFAEECIQTTMLSAGVPR